MLQRSNVTAMSAATGALGKYVNRLGWAVSSEEQRLAALGRIKEFITFLRNCGGFEIW